MAQAFQTDAFDSGGFDAGSAAPPTTGTINAIAATVQVAQVASKAGAKSGISPIAATLALGQVSGKAGAKSGVAPVAATLAVAQLSGQAGAKAGIAGVAATLAIGDLAGRAGARSGVAPVAAALQVAELAGSASQAGSRAGIEGISAALTVGQVGARAGVRSGIAPITATVAVYQPPQAQPQGAGFGDSFPEVHTGAGGAWKGQKPEWLSPPPPVRVEPPAVAGIAPIAARLTVAPPATTRSAIAPIRATVQVNQISGYSAENPSDEELAAIALVLLLEAA